MVSVQSGPNFQSSDTRGLEAVTNTRYPTNDPNFSQTIGDLKDNVKYLSGYMQQMQQGIDQNNTNVSDSIGNLISGLLGLWTGQTQQGPIDWGDFKYYFTALGALFGFGTNVNYPINLENAAEQFFLGYVIPGDAFTQALNASFKTNLENLGFSDTAINDLLQMQAALAGPGQVIQNDITEFFNSVQQMLNIFGINTATDNQLSIMWTKLSKLFGPLDADQVTNIQQFIDNLTIDLSTGVTKALDWLTSILQVFSDSQDVSGFLNFGSLFTGPNWTASPFDPSAAWEQLASNYITQTEAFNAQVLNGIDSSFATILNYMGFPAIPGSGVQQFGGIVTTIKNYISGVFNQSQIPDVTVSMSQDMQHIIDLIYQSQFGGISTGNALSSIFAALTNISQTSISGLEAALGDLVSTGDWTPLLNVLFGGTTINSTVQAAAVPGLDASKITTGTFAQSFINNLDTEVQKIELMFTAPNMVLDSTFDNPIMWTGATGSQTSSRAHSGTNSWQLVGAG
jgi:hypothetical protein